MGGLFCVRGNNGGVRACSRPALYRHRPALKNTVKSCFVEICIPTWKDRERSVGDSPTFILCYCKGGRVALPPLAFFRESTINLKKRSFRPKASKNGVSEKVA